MIIIFLIIFFISFYRTDIGILIVTISLSTVVIPFLYQPIPGIGGIQSSDFALMGIAANLLLYKKLNLNRDKRIFIFICLWFLLIAIIEILPGGKGINASYNLFIRTGLLWLVPVAAMTIPIERRKRIFLYLIGCALFITVIQAYAFIGKNPAFVVRTYYQFQNPDFFANPEENLRYYYEAGILPRIYPSGALLVQMVTIFLIGVLLGKKVRSRLETVALFCAVVAFFGFIISLRQRSAMISLCISLVFLLIGQAKINNRRKSPVLIFSLGLAILVGVGIFEKVFNYSFIEELTAHFKESLFNVPNRMLDNGLAISALLRSPLFGVGRPNLIEEAKASGLNTLGRDVHPFLAAGLLAGIPLIIMVCKLIFDLYRRYRLRQKAPHPWVMVAEASAILYVLLLAFANTAPIFTSEKDMVPFLIFSGLFLSSSNKNNPPKR